MRRFFKSLSSQSTTLKAIGLLIMRVGLGLIFLRHGSTILSSGPEQWKFLGSTMANIGVTFFPTFWGFCAGLVQALGGAMLVAGFGTRVAAFFLSFVMFIAFIMHVVNGDAWAVTSHPLSLLVVFMGLTVAGSGRLSLDMIFFGK